jgi:hypothetical protein
MASGAVDRVNSAGIRWYVLGAARADGKGANKETQDQ